MMWVVDCCLRRKSQSYIDGATKFKREPWADGALGSRHMVHMKKLMLVQIMNSVGTNTMIIVNNVDIFNIIDVVNNIFIV